MDTAAPAPDILRRRTEALLAAGHLNAAAAVLAALRRLAPAGPEEAALGARIALAGGRLDEALATLDAAIGAAPAHAGLRRLRADLRQRAGARVEAAIDAAEAVALDPADASGKAILGVLMSELGRPEDAVACLGEALAADPANPSFIEALAAAEAAGGDTARAAATLAAGIARAPGRVELRDAAVLLAIRRRDFDAAATMAEAARRAGAVDATLFGLHGHALSCLGRHEEAGEAYALALQLGPNDPYVRHLVAASGALPGAERAPSPYVRAVFDGCADRFETQLIALGYRVPGLFRAALVALAPWERCGAPFGPVLDLGCGTGLAGLAISDLPVGPLHGVDLSPRMLEQAARKGIYAGLTEADILSFLGAPGTSFLGAPGTTSAPAPAQSWGLILAADVLCYFGALDPLLPAAHARLRPGGIMLISCETTADRAPPGWRLGARGRYAHHPGQVRAAAEAAGLRVLSLAAETQRHENDAPVPGLVGVLVRP